MSYQNQTSRNMRQGGPRGGLLTSCNKNVHFSFNESYIQIDRVAMGSPLGSVRANIFMIELVTTLVPKLEDHVQKWRCFADDTFVCVCQDWFS